MNPALLAHFEEHRQAATLSEPLAAALEAAAELLVNAFVNDGKVLCCGNAGSALMAQHFAALLSGRFESERMGLPALALTTPAALITAIGNDYDFSQIFSRQIKALGKSGDVLTVISTSGNSPNAIAAVSAANERDMSVLALTGKDGGRVAQLLGENDVLLNVAHERQARIQEVHMLFLHLICDSVDKILFGDA